VTEHRTFFAAEYDDQTRVPIIATAGRIVAIPSAEAPVGAPA
jgi:hypothetical protein